VDVQFRLVYRGPLPSHGSGGSSGERSKQQHAIRKQLHPQLKELWSQNRFLRNKLRLEVLAPIAQMAEGNVTWKIPYVFKEDNFNLVPLITKSNGLACALEILFLRRDNPGNLVKSGGDIDNRIKVLFDALHIPDRGSMTRFMPESGENPFFCLLEDDQLITEVSVTTDRLLVPLESDEHIHDVILILSVTAKVIDANAADFDFLGG
jgi:hypothetical protein